MSAYTVNVRNLKREVKEAKHALKKAELRLKHLPRAEPPNERPKSGEVLQSGCGSCSKPIKRRFRLWDHKGKWAGDYCTERCADLDARDLDSRSTTATGRTGRTRSGRFRTTERARTKRVRFAYQQPRRIACSMT